MNKRPVIAGMALRAVRGTGCAQVSPINVGAQILAAHLPFGGLFNGRAVFRRDAARQHPLLHGLIPAHLERLCGPYRAAQKVDRAFDCLYGFHRGEGYTSKTSNASPSCSETRVSCEYTAGMDTFAIRLKSRLDALDLSFERAAALLGVSWQSVQQWCNGKTSPRRNKEAMIAKVLNCRAEWLFYGQGYANDAGATNDVSLSANSIVRQNRPHYSRNKVDWPFPAVDFSRIAALAEKDKRFVEGVLLDAVTRCESDVSVKRRIGESR